MLLTFSLSVGASWWVRNTDSVHWPKLLVTLTVWLSYLDGPAPALARPAGLGPLSPGSAS
jgi:hypothetical protein